MGCILKFLLFIFILGFIGAVRFWWTIRTLVHNARKQAQEQPFNQQTNGHAEESNQSNETFHKTSTDHKKVFADNEGEYVDFEEVKD